jgi:replicative DNA helicase
VTPRPEYDRDTEIALLASCVFSRLARERARVIVTGPDFHQPKHEAVWNAMLALDRQGVAVDALTLRAALEGQGVDALLVEVVSEGRWLPANAEHYAQRVHEWAVRRRVAAAARVTLDEAFAPAASVPGWPEKVASRFAREAASGSVEDVTGRFAFEYEADPPKQPPWMLPDLLARGERLILTGNEGTGKSHLLRQIAVAAAGGVDPFEPAYQYEPVKVAILDYENAEHLGWEAVAVQIEQVRQWGQDPGRNLYLDYRRPTDITQDRVLSGIHRLLESQGTDLLVIGPLYHLAPEAIQTDTEATPILAALDSLRGEHGCALILEAHAGHGKDARNRDLRPRGSSALMGWPDFGYGVRWTEAPGVAEFKPWRGARILGRKWPRQLRRRDGRWVEA